MSWVGGVSAGLCGLGRPALVEWWRVAGGTRHHASPRPSVCGVRQCCGGPGPGGELTGPPNPLAIFCCQVFFVYYPSSSTSLLSSAMDQTKAKNGNRDEGESPEHAGCRLVGGATETWYLVLGSLGRQKGDTWGELLWR